MATSHRVPIRQVQVHLCFSLSFPMAVLSLSDAGAWELAHSHQVLVPVVEDTRLLATSHRVPTRQVQVHLGFALPFSLPILLLSDAGPRQITYRNHVLTVPRRRLHPLATKHSVPIGQAELHLSFSLSLSLAILLQRDASTWHLTHRHDPFLHRARSCPILYALGPSRLKGTPLHRLQLLEGQLKNFLMRATFLIRPSDLEHGMLMVDLGLAAGAKVEVGADDASVTGADDLRLEASVALNFMLLDAEIVDEKVDNCRIAAITLVEKYLD